MTQHQAQIELQEIEKIAEAITRGNKYHQITFHLVELPKGQRTGTYYQRKSYALIKAREIYNKYKK
tara:strand:- start:1116 stop:1313 length:198 start_codon:yes stop_codon:yes gene_type:complete